MKGTLEKLWSKVWRSFGVIIAAGMMVLITAFLAAGPALELRPLAAGAAYFAMVGAFFLMIQNERTSGLREAFTIQPIAPHFLRPVLLATASIVVLIPCLAVVNRRIFPDQVHPADPINDLLGQPLGWLPFLCVSILFAPLVEELVDRGWLQRKLEKSWGAIAAIVLSSVFFGLFHMVLWMAPYFTIVGAIFGYSVYVTRSVWTGVILHMAANTSLTVLGFLISDGVFESWVDPSGFGVVIAPAGIIVGGGALIYLDWSRRALTAPDAPSPPSSASVLA